MKKQCLKFFMMILVACLMFNHWFVQSALAVSPALMSDFTSVPINLTGNAVTPLVMLNASRDHQLSYKAYNDYSDLTGDGVPETTYNDTVDYYGYFDSSKCYTYNTTSNRFVPAALATGANNHYCSGQWSGNFMNWATMTRMDVVRKMLYGGMRSTDTSSITVLERQYLPTDAHSFAKYYNGSDINQLTPFTGISTTPPQAVSNTSRTIPTHTTGTATRTFDTTLSASIGDQIKVFVTGNESTQWMIGGVSGTGSGAITITIHPDSFAGGGTTSTTWTLRNLSRTGITITNLTTGTTSGTNRYSDTNINPPIIRVAQGNFALWTANERWQSYWFGEKNHTQSGFAGGFRSNGNRAYLSGINASAENPSQTTHGLGTGSAQGEYIVRVEVCDSSLLGQEKCKQYGSTYKPIGLLQVYGDEDLIHFGLMTGSYSRNVSGGVLRKNVVSFSNEVNSADGTFVTGANGIVHNFDRLRLYGYDYNDGTYIGRDNCTYQQTGFVLSGGSTSGGQPANQGNCSSWGNPMSEMYLESLRYLAGKSATSAFEYGSGSKDDALGLTLASWSDPLNNVNYCAPLSVLNFNASVSGYDGDQVGGMADLGATLTAQELTDIVGVGEGIDTANWFIGNNSITQNDLCASKAIGDGLGSFYGLCPEAPSQKGTYLMSGMAYYANTNRIRTDLIVPSARDNSRDLMVSTYGIALATNVPKIEIKTAANEVVTILPAYRLDRYPSFGGGTLVDFKIIEQTPSYGKYYVNWEDSEMGGDYDQDMWGTIEYTVSGSTITITTNAVSASTANGQGFGYIISGTDRDGAHFHSGIYGFNFTDPTGVTGCTNCQVGDSPTSWTYTISGVSAGILEDPLWYAAKWGGFIDSNNTKLPNVMSEWDAVNNSTGAPVPDGIPDNYFYATNPLQLENALNRVFLAILQRSSSGTAAAVVSNNVSGIGALYQAYYEPMRQDASNSKVTWIGTVQSLWLDDYGYLREDNNSNAVLDGYLTDKVIQQFYDDAENKTKVRRYTSTSDNEFIPHFMKGTVTAFAGSSVTFTVNEIGGSVGNGPFGDWTVYNLTTNDSGSSSNSVSISAIGSSVTMNVVAPLTFNVGQAIEVNHLNYTVISLEEVKTLWNAREQLSFSVANPATQRAYTNPANDTATGGRHIITGIDVNNSGVVDPGELVSFASASLNAGNFGYLNVATLADAQSLVNYIRGEEMTGGRNRTINYDGTGNKVMRLSDIVNSTPTIVGAPQEALDLLYKDSSYTVFRNQYINRRQVLYTGSNGGMLHAFNGGFYNSSTRSFNTAGKQYDGTTDVVEHPLGAELWAYVPMNLLPHLKWLKDPNYSHVYYVDGKPKVFDAKIFADDADHPGGWGTVLVVGMRFGGGAITVDGKNFKSSYVIMDITNPEVAPKLIAEIQVPDGSFSTSYPTALAVTNSNWYLLFGSGPTSLSTAESNQSAKIYSYDLNALVSNASTAPVVWDTAIANSFVGDPIAVDWELNYRANSVYFGLSGGINSTSGRVMRLDSNQETDHANWIAPVTLLDTAQPVVAGVTPGIDRFGNKWIFFGTGRLFVSADQLSTATQSIYGLRDAGTTLSKSDLTNVSNAQVELDGTLTQDVGTNTTFDELRLDIRNNSSGWYLDLPPIFGTAGTAPATRVMNSSALAGGVLFTTAYQPGLDLCTGEGFSRLYGLYYETGTANPRPAILGTDVDASGNEYAKRFIELGVGFATTPSLHTGSRSGGGKLSVFTQLSTGAIMRTEATPVQNVRSGFQSWIEVR